MQRYLETRSIQNTSTASDLARHLLPRQHLGKTVVVCDKPVIMMSLTRKYWLKLLRTLLRERSSTLNVEKILQLTYDITHMQHMDFAAKPYYTNPEADVFFITPDQLDRLPPHCFSLYIVDEPPSVRLNNAITQLPEKALVVDYSESTIVAEAPLLPKRQLEQQVPGAWQYVAHYFTEHHINIERLSQYVHHPEALNEAIDVILNTSSEFLRTAGDFLEILTLAQPLINDNSTQQRYDLVALLHRRIYALTPGNLSQQFAQSLGGDEPGAHDIALEKLALVLAM
jgi:hypothetical protein